MEAKLSGDAWRWNLGSDGRSVSRTTIGVIEPKGDAPKQDEKSVPFGFGIRDEPEWYGNPS